MDESAVKKIVGENIERLKNELGLTDWDIKINYGFCDGDPALNICDTDYKIADVTLDPTCIENEVEVLHILRHELVHCIVNVFSTYRRAVSCFLTEAEREAMDIIYRNADEQLVCDFVRILERMKSENQAV